MRFRNTYKKRGMNKYNHRRTKRKNTRNKNKNQRNTKNKMRKYKFGGMGGKKKTVKLTRDERLKKLALNVKPVITEYKTHFFR